MGEPKYADDNAQVCDEGDLTENNGDIVETPGTYDVLLGRGRTYRYHPGNLRFQGLINTYRDRYANARMLLGKWDITMAIVEAVLKDGRFLKPSPNGKTWLVIPLESARQKVAHAIQYQNRRNSAQNPKRYREEPSPRSTMQALDVLPFDDVAGYLPTDSETEDLREAHLAHQARPSFVSPERKGQGTPTMMSPRMYRHLAGDHQVATPLKQEGPHGSIGMKAFMENRNAFPWDADSESLADEEEEFGLSFQNGSLEFRTPQGKHGKAVQSCMDENCRDMNGPRMNFNQGRDSSVQSIPQDIPSAPSLHLGLGMNRDDFDESKLSDDLEFEIALATSRNKMLLRRLSLPNAVRSRPFLRSPHAPMRPDQFPGSLYAPDLYGAVGLPGRNENPPASVLDGKACPSVTPDRSIGESEDFLRTPDLHHHRRFSMPNGGSHMMSPQMMMMMAHRNAMSAPSIHNDDLVNQMLEEYEHLQSLRQGNVGGFGREWSQLPSGFAGEHNSEAMLRAYTRDGPDFMKLSHPAGRAVDSPDDGMAADKQNRSFGNVSPSVVNMVNMQQ